MMTDFETRLKDGLSADDEAFLNGLEHEDGLFQQMGGTFSGPLKYWTVFAFILSFVFAGLAGFGLYQVWLAETTKAMFMWFALFSFAALAVSMLKIWFWLRMNHMATMRELKRIELRIARGT